MQFSQFVSRSKSTGWQYETKKETMTLDRMIIIITITIKNVSKARIGMAPSKNFSPAYNFSFHSNGFLVSFLYAMGVHPIFVREHKKNS